MSGFSQFLEDEKVKAKWLKIREWTFLRESTYDMTNKCNLRCEGCYYYAGTKSMTTDEPDPAKWKAMFESEKQRGITYAVLAGAEPALVPNLCLIAYQTIPWGSIATNGTVKIPEEVQYKIHISVWGDDDYSSKYRKVDNCLEKQLKAYQGDKRAVFIYTFSKENIHMIDDITKKISDHGGKISFNQFSSPVGYKGPLRFDKDSLTKMREKIQKLLELYPQNVLYSPYNIHVHCNEKSIHDQFSCPYPRMNKNNRVIGLGKTFRQYRSNLTIDNEAACCVPDTDCADCRHYAPGSAVVTAKLLRHVDTKEHFSNWLDYVDNYLEVWVNGYTKNANLIQH